MILLISILFLWAIWGCIRPSVSLTPFTMEATLPLRGVLAMGIVIHHISLRVVDATPDDSWLLKIVLPLVLCSLVFESTSITLWEGKTADFRLV